MNIELIIRSLGARRSGSSWMAKCPAHNDTNPSLAIRELDGKILLHCHAGCQQKDVINNLKRRGVWKSEAVDGRPVNRIVETYKYTDEDGRLLYEIVRYDPKDFSQRQPDGYGGWIWKK